MGVVWFRIYRLPVEYVALTVAVNTISVVLEKVVEVEELKDHNINVVFARVCIMIDFMRPLLMGFFVRLDDKSVGGD